MKDADRQGIDARPLPAVIDRPGSPLERDQAMTRAALAENLDHGEIRRRFEVQRMAARYLMPCRRPAAQGDGDVEATGFKSAAAG